MDADKKKALKTLRALTLAAWRLPRSYGLSLAGEYNLYKNIWEM
jgi:hypothetical protein